MDQFMHVSLMATIARRNYVLDTFFFPSDGLKSNLKSLPSRATIYCEEIMEAEAEHLKATDKINLHK